MIKIGNFIWSEPTFKEKFLSPLSIYFIPPEQRLHGKLCDKSIVWSLGALLFILLGGNPDQLIEENFLRWNIEKNLFKSENW